MGSTVSEQAGPEKTMFIDFLVESLFTKHSDSWAKSWGVFSLDDVNEPFHDNISFALPIIDTQDQIVVGEDIRVMVYIFHSHLGN